MKIKELNLSSQQEEKLKRYTETLLEWNKIHNLSGAKTENEVWENIEDSLYPITFLPEYESMLDIGSGAGFPGLMLAIAREKMTCVLCEPIQKKASFLHYASVELGLENVIVISDKVENIADQTFDLVVSRAVMDAKALIGLCDKIRQKETHFLFYKGEQVDQEVESDWNYDVIPYQKRQYLYIKGV